MSQYLSPNGPQCSVVFSTPGSNLIAHGAGGADGASEVIVVVYNMKLALFGYLDFMTGPVDVDFLVSDAGAEKNGHDSRFSKCHVQL